MDDVCPCCGKRHATDDLEACRNELAAQLAALREMEGPALKELWRVLREAEVLKLQHDDLRATLRAGA